MVTPNADRAHFHSPPRAPQAYFSSGEAEET
jgi:hypothetical protein